MGAYKTNLEKMSPKKRIFSEDKMFLLVELVIFLVLLSITILEVMRFGRYEELFRKYQVHISWFFGITFGIVFANVKTKLQTKFSNKFKIKSKRETSFPLFIAKLLVIVFFSAVIIGIARAYLVKLFIFTPLLMAQWLIILYIWFKFENGVKPALKYLLTNEIILVINLIILLLAFII